MEVESDLNERSRSGASGWAIEVLFASKLVGMKHRAFHLLAAACYGSGNNWKISRIPESRSIREINMVGFIFGKTQGS